MIPAKYWSPTKKLMLLGAMAGGKAVEDTATGNPLTFLTNLAKPLKSLLIPFTPKQTGSGDPSPSNIRPIVPWDGLTVSGGGKNLFNKTAGRTGVWWDGRVLGDYTDYKASEKIPVVPSAKYVLSKAITGQNQVQYFDKNGDYLRQDPAPLGYLVSRLTVPADVYFIAFNIANTALDTAQLEVGETATVYEPYKPITETDISFPSPVYGGEHEAVSGRLADGWTICTIKGTERTIRFSGDYRFGIYINDVIPNYKKPKTVVGSADSPYIVCDKLLSRSIYRVNSGTVGVAINEQGDTFWISNGEQNLTEAQVREWLANNNLQIAYALAEPQGIQLTPQQITALVGNNTLWSDADGQMAAIYLKKG